MVHVVTPVPWVPLILNIRPKVVAIYSDQKVRWISRHKRCSVRLSGRPHPFNALNGLWIAARLIPEVYQIRRTFPFDLIHSHMLTPDGLAGKPSCQEHEGSVGLHRQRKRFEYLSLLFKDISGTQPVLRFNTTGPLSPPVALWLMPL